MNKNIGWIMVGVCWIILFTIIRTQGTSDNWDLLLLIHPLAIIFWLLFALLFFGLGKLANKFTSEPQKSIAKGTYLASVILLILITITVGYKLIANII